MNSDALAVSDDSNPFRPLQAIDFLNPSILLAGVVDHMMYAFFRDRLMTAPREGIVVIELSTLGGDPEVARMMGEDIRFHSEQEPARRFVFLGKAAIYSAGATFMSFLRVRTGISRVGRGSWCMSEKFRQTSLWMVH